jgi:GNAT superfamily N-acetyltransferase
MSAAVADDVVLRDGATVQVRRMEADDAPRLVQFHETLSSETVYLRFFSVHPHLSDPEVHRFTHVDHRDREAIVALHGDDIVGVARYDRLPGRDEAETAFVVTDTWQGRGLGAALLRHLAGLARAEGLTRLLAETLPHNRRMLAVFHHAGLPLTTRVEDGVVHVTLEL